MAATGQRKESEGTRWEMSLSERLEDQAATTVSHAGPQDVSAPCEMTETQARQPRGRRGEGMSG